MKGISLAIIGLGPFARNVHLPLCLELGVTPKLVVDLEGFNQEVFPEELKGVDFIQLPTSCRLGFKQSEPAIIELIKKLQGLSIDHVILSSEPLSHLSYLELFHQMKLSVMCDKPLLVEKDIDFSLEAVGNLRRNHNKILDLYSQEKSPQLNLNLDLRHSMAHQSFIATSREHAEKYDALPESLSIFYAGGNWCMPQEFIEREGHPFKYGYGTLFHTAFHYVDFVSQYLQSLMASTADEVDHFDVVCLSESPKDVLDRMGARAGLDDSSAQYSKIDFKGIGSANVQYIIRVKTKRGRTTKINLEFLNCGLSSRIDSAPPQDNYRGSGRNKTEGMRLMISPDCVVSLEDIRGAGQRVARKTSALNRDGKVTITIDDYSDSNKKQRRLPILFNFFMGAHAKNPRILDIGWSLKFFEILLEANVLATQNDGQSVSSYKA
jgi:hypothetical protein